ncbi:Phthalate dioxygenase reductase [Methylobacterium crusticola]|uniref:Phthalate dioxygenase reductase n=1 Tax=Methylobacterium crusticola TaxID=1697972 RepID=A0ABQ4QZA2_9HYPH|nr:PDR/VanB family oxidoreductase [Methylobacterium crusticola]GJD50583.1 Phthalate dioxygenase reductase [Methylobacterium crusticola]
MSPRLIMKLEVAQVRPEAGDVLLVALRHPRRPLLPAATAGAHVDVHLPDGRVRQYSLLGDPADRRTYRIAVKREAGGRGGSRWLHDNLAAGATLMVSAPRNHFELSAAAGRCLLLAGGIGITPLLAMAHALAAAGRDFRLHVFARGRAGAPLLGEAEAFGPDRVVAHFDDPPGTRLALEALLREPEPGTEIYCCGPAGFMDAVREAASGWPDEAVRFEAFQPLHADGFVPEPFDIVLRSTGATLRVPAGRAAIDLLREAGIDVPSSCEIGVCGACVCGYLAGSPIHRDVVLSPRARRDRFIPCVSRAVGALRLDL